VHGYNAQQFLLVTDDPLEHSSSSLSAPADAEIPLQLMIRSYGCSISAVMLLQDVALHALDIAWQLISGFMEARVATAASASLHNTANNRAPWCF
jgi:hypothetical protein